MVLRTLRFCLAVVVAVASLIGPLGTARGDVIDDIAAEMGFAALRARLGVAAPTGAGVVVTQVESGGTSYQPDKTQPVFAGKTFVAHSSGSGTSSHATTVASLFYGSGGGAPGASTIHLYEANSWIGTGQLRTQTAQAPLTAVGKVINNSWVATLGSDSSQWPAEQAAATDTLRRLDLMIARDGTIVVEGVNNGVDTTMPLLLANSYNGIAVGLVSGGSSQGGSSVDGIGRSKPDIVARGDYPGTSGPTVSRAVPWVSAAAALLVDEADSNTWAQRPETVKSLLLTGATKTAFDLNHQTASTLDDWSHTPTQPLDLRYGAGELNVDHSSQILEAGQYVASATSLSPSTGWDNNPVGATHKYHFFRVEAGSTTDSMAITAAWNRDVTLTTNGSAPATLNSSLNNVQLRLYKADVSADHHSYQVTGAPLQQSVSTIDNVQYVYTDNLAPGLYAIDMNANASTNVGLAWDWRGTTAPPANLSVTSVNNQSVVNLTDANQGGVFAGASAGLVTPLGVTHDAAGQLYVASTFSNKVLKFDGAGHSTVVADLSSGVVSPTALAFDPSGNLYVANYLANNILKIDSAGHSSVFASGTSGLSGPFGLAVDSIGRVYATSLDSHSVLRFDSSGAATVIADSSDGISTPIDLVIDSKGDVFVSDVFSNRVLRIDAAGQVTTFADLTHGVISPTGLAFDANGDLFVSNYLADTIVRLDPLGNNTGTYGTGANGISGPWGLDFAGGSTFGSFNLNVVPEPSTVVLVLSALLLLCGRTIVRRFRR